MELHGASLDGGVNAANQGTGGVRFALSADKAPVRPAHEVVGQWTTGSGAQELFNLWEKLEIVG